MKKYYVRSDIESRITDFLTVGMRAWGYHTDQERNDVDNLNGLQMQKSIPGIYPRYDGKYGVPEATEEDPSASNPVYFINNAEGYYKQTKFFVNPYVKVNFLKHFTASYNFYYDHFRNEHKWNSSDYREQFSFQAGEVKTLRPLPTPCKNIT